MQGGRSKCNPTTARVLVRPDLVAATEAPARGGAAPAATGLAPELPFAESRVVLAAPALLVEASFRGVPLASRLLRADEAKLVHRRRGARRRRAGQPGVPVGVRPRWPAGMRWSSRSRRVGRLRNQPGARDARRAADAACRCCRCGPTSGTPRRRSRCRRTRASAWTCGEVAFDVYAAEPAAEVARPRFGADLREGGATRRRRADVARAAVDRARHPRGSDSLSGTTSAACAG